MTEDIKNKEEETDKVEKQGGEKTEREEEKTEKIEMTTLRSLKDKRRSYKDGDKKICQMGQKSFQY